MSMTQSEYELTKKNLFKYIGNDSYEALKNHANTAIKKALFFTPVGLCFALFIGYPIVLFGGQIGLSIILAIVGYCLYSGFNGYIKTKQFLSLLENDPEFCVSAIIDKKAA